MKMAEALDIHMRALDVVSSAIERGDLLLAQLKRHAEMARPIHARLQANREERLRTARQRIEAIESAAVAPGVPDAQQKTLHALAREMQADAQKAADQSLELETALQPLFATVEDTPAKKAPAASSPSATRFNNVELF